MKRAIAVDRADFEYIGGFFLIDHRSERHELAAFQAAVQLFADLGIGGIGKNAAERRARGTILHRAVVDGAGCCDSHLPACDRIALDTRDPRDAVNTSFTRVRTDHTDVRQLMPVREPCRVKCRGPAETAELRR